jgi:hypothetical protein
MNVGDVFVWETTKAKGHDSRPKLHVFICPGDWEIDNVFLFISSINYEGDFLLKASDYTFLRYDSYVACHSIVAYSDDDLTQCAPTPLGRLLLKDVSALHAAIAASQIMEVRHIHRICAALRAAY